MLDVRLARLGLPLPLEPAIGRALMHRERAAQHEGLVVAWELAVRILAGSLWAACRHANLSSSALERATAKLERPSMGHWVELARTCASLLRESDHAVSQAFRATLDGLEAPLPAECGLRTLVARIAELDGALPRPRRVQEALDQLPHYRNQAQSTHKDVGPAFREASVEPLLAGLVDFCERVPLVGACSLVLVGRLESRGQGGLAEIARLHGTFPTWAQREIAASAWPALVSSRPYLQVEPDLWLPLHPMAAVAHSGAEWHVGWYARQVHVPTVAYQGAGGHEFQLVLAPDELELLVRGARREGEPAPNAAALALEPFRGLLAYDEEHAAIYFGREEETEAATARIEHEGALFVFGASGSGKSSWLRAGILPALRARATLAGRRLLPIVLLPGDHPLATLRQALTHARGGTPEEAAAWARTVDEALPPLTKSGAPRLAHQRGLAHLLRGLAAQGTLPTLVVDQLEEAAMLALDREESRAFLTLVATAAASAKDMGAVVLASARADLLAPLLEHESVRQFLEHHGAPVGSIPPERLGRVITEPLRGRKVPLEAGLAETILADVADEPGSLALLSQVLTTLWSERGRFGGALTKQGYIDAGRVSGALEKQAEAALSEARARADTSSGASSAKPASVSGSPSPPAPSPASHSATEKRVDRLFRALAASDEGERFTRRRVELRSLASELGTTPEEIRALAQPFVSRRLVVLSAQGHEETVEVAHERLLVAWPRLANLLASEREVLELRAEIEAAASAWQASGGRRELWSDSTSKLRRGEELLAAGRLDVDDRSRDFLAASRRSVRWRKRVERSVLAAVVLLAMAAGYGMWSARQAAEREGQAKESAQRNAEAARQARDEATQKANDVLSLSAQKDHDDLVSEAAKLWPAHPELVGAYEDWLRRANELIDGRPEAPGQKRRPSLAEHKEKLAELRRGALPLTADEIRAERESHPQFAELQAKQAELLWQSRMLEVEPWPSEAEVEAALASESLPGDAQALNSLAWRLVDPAQPVYGQELRALLLARRAVAAAAEEERSGIRDTLAWALLRVARFDKALAEARTALSEPGGDALKSSVEDLEKEVASWREDEVSKRLEARERLAEQVSALTLTVNERRRFEHEDEEQAWWDRSLSKLVGDLEALRDPNAGLMNDVLAEPFGWGMAKRHAFARSIGDRSVDGPEAQRLWAEAIAAIAASPKYGGLVVEPQMGLVPIGMDPDSQLWEFAHLQTGEPAVRGGDGRLVLSEETGLVFVLIPGGTFWMGAQNKPGAENHDPGARTDEGPVHEVELSPYFLSKYEMTQGQWQRIAAVNPSSYQPPGNLAPSLLHPVEQVSWTMCFKLLGDLGLLLPSEAQWEHAARGGTSTTWWTGADRERLRGKVNLADQAAKKAGALWPAIADWPDLEDGSAVHCAVGKYAANPFGLHEVAGNVWEWCLDGYDSGFYRQSPAKDPESPWAGSATRVFRGGSFASAASLARSAYRSLYTPASQDFNLGLRPSRALRLSASPLHPPK